MVRRRSVDKHKYLAAFTIATLIFLMGVFLGNYFSEQKLNSIDELSRNLQLNTIGTELQFRLISENPCEFLNSSELTEELYQIGARLDFMESEMGQENTQVVGLKEYYHLLEIRHWLFLKRSKEECSKDFDLVLYFYSNEGDCPKCEEQGNVLTYLHKKYPKLNIYSFDVNIENPALRTIKRLYDIEGQPPTIVVNEDTYHGFMSSKEIEMHLVDSSSFDEISDG